MTCDWAVDRSCLPELPAEDADGYEAALLARNGAEDLAVAILWALSGRQYGVCTTTVRPCPTPLGGYRGGSPVVLIRYQGRWMNVPCGCRGRCQRTGPNVVHLPGPVVAVDAVTIGGQVLPESAYALEGDVLYRREAHWPMQYLDRPLGDPGTWAVEYRRGQPVPPGVDKLTGLLAQELLAACSGSGKCRLPRNVTNVTRQGVTYQVYDPNAIYSAGKTGLPEVDTWLAAVNPHRVTQAPVVL